MWRRFGQLRSESGLLSCRHFRLAVLQQAAWGGEAVRSRLQRTVPGATGHASPAKRWCSARVRPWQAAATSALRRRW